jgi:hypothetical protein
MAKLKEMSVSLSRKTWSDKAGSMGVDAGVVIEIEEGEDKDELYAGTISWLSAKVGGTLKAHGSVSSQPELATVPAGAVVKPAQHPTPIPAGAVPGKVSQDDEDIFDVDSIVIEVMPDGVTKTAKAKGGKWTKYGVKVWDEVLALPPLEWDLKALDVAEYGPPDGLQAVVMMVDGKPRKVLEWK